jgi:hypothetical protein
MCTKLEYTQHRYNVLWAEAVVERQSHAWCKLDFVLELKSISGCVRNSTQLHVALLYGDINEIISHVRRFATYEHNLAIIDVLACPKRNNFSCAEE